MTYARARLWLGITGVGTIVVLAALALALDWPRRLFASGAPLDEIAIDLAIVMAAYVGLMLPFDLVGGLNLPRRFEQARRERGSVLVSWLRGSVVQAAIFWIGTMLVVIAGRAAGLPAAAATYLGLMLVLLLGQGLLARLVADLRTSSRTRPSGDLIVLHSDDPTFTGGLTGLPGRERVVVPEHWYELLGEEGVEVACRRRALIGSRGWRRQGVIAALLWNLLGFTLAALAPGAGVADLPGILTLFLWLTLWTFGGLLLLPILSRLSIFAGDDAILAEGADRERLATNLRLLDRVGENEPERSEALESVFHPVPSVERRIAHFGKQQAAVLAPWNVARTALFLTWAGLGWLARAVHCNSGKPEVWVMLPCD